MNEMIERAVKALELAQGNAPFYLMPQFKNKYIVYQMMQSTFVDIAMHSGFLSNDQAEDLCERLNNEWVVKKVIESIKEPTNEMKDVGHLYASIGSVDAGDAYSRMIEFILSGE